MKATMCLVAALFNGEFRNYQVKLFVRLIVISRLVSLKMHKRQAGEQTNFSDACVAFSFQPFYLVLSRRPIVALQSMNPLKLMRVHQLFFFLAIVTISSCKKETETLQTEALSSYIPTQTGKYITYRLDSTIFTNFG